MAKDPKQEQTPPDFDENTEPLGPPKSYRLMVNLGLVCLILFQMIILYLLLPSKAIVGPNVGVNVNNGTRIFSEAPGVTPNAGRAPKTTEIHIPDKDVPIKVTNTRNDSTDTFSASITVQILDADKKDFERRYTQCTAEVIDQITSILHSSTFEERKEAGHTVLKEKLLRGINGVLKTSWVRQVFFANPIHEVQ